MSIPNGEYNPEQKSVLQVKFEAEIRLCLGFATEIKKETTVDGSVKAVEIGKRLNPYIHLKREDNSHDERLDADAGE